jgi:hypothetical protein
MDEFLADRPNRLEEAAFIHLCASWHGGGMMANDQLVINVMVHARDEIIGFGRTPPKVPRHLPLPGLHEWAERELADLPCRVCGGGHEIESNEMSQRIIAVRCVCEES